MRIFRYDPFSVLDKRECTVGRLRARAEHVDLTPIRGAGGVAPGRGEDEVVRMAHVAKQLAGALDG